MFVLCILNTYITNAMASSTYPDSLTQDVYFMGRSNRRRVFHGSV